MDNMSFLSLETPLMREKCKAWRLEYLQCKLPAPIDLYDKNWKEEKI
ncbi:hypothetical protein [Butyrivibrio fibrisolvens]|nr:hypothetical protein [Butyrivibrio fibrisolvens]